MMMVQLVMVLIDDDGVDDEEEGRGADTDVKIHASAPSHYISLKFILLIQKNLQKKIKHIIPE